MTWGSFGLSHTRGIHDAAGQSAKRDGLICNPALSRWLGLKACWLLPSILFCNSMIRSFHSQKLLGVPSSPLHNFHCTPQSTVSGKAYTFENPIILSFFVHPQRFPSIFPLIPSNCLPDSGNITIGCLAQGFKPDPVSFSWRKSNQIIDANLSEDFPSLAQPDGTFTTSSQVIVPVTDWNKYSHFYCTAVHYNHNETIQVIRPSKFMHLLCSIQSCSLSRPAVYILPPAAEEQELKETVTLTCLVKNFCPSDIFLQWLHNGQLVNATEYYISEPIPQSGSNSQFFLYSMLTVNEQQWSSGDTFTCMVGHEALPFNTTQKTVDKKTGGPSSPPSVYILPPPTEELALKETATLTCLANNFYPNEVLVQWLQNNQPVSRSKYITSKPTQESEKQNSYYVYSKLTISEQDWSNNDQFTCVVGHEALPLYTTQKTIDKTMGKPAVINVSLQFSDTLTTCY
uniref:Ig-like domain-containing protein n=1 Tax=Varanus komodoensis TaxID=61221 RepID=A0A8D2L3L8_VARKO